MDHLRPRILFFTGTDTDVGKTYVAALAVKELTQLGRRVGVYKPVASGCIAQGAELVSSDAVNLWEASGQIHPLHDVCPQRFIAPLAPQSAAKLEGKQVDEALLLRGIDAVAQGVDMIVAEGAGGLMSPLSENLLNSDLARRLDAHVVIVAANRLGTIHQVLAAVTAASALRLPVVGIVLNQTSETNDLAVNDNAATIARFTQVPILGQLAYGAAMTGIDWTSLPPPREVSTQIGKAWL